MVQNHTIRKFAELGIACAAVATLILAGCGGGGGSSSNNSGGTSTTTTTVTPFKGMFTSGMVSLKDANGNPVMLISGGAINSNGTASLTYPANVAYPLTVEVAGTFLDETSGVGATGTITAGAPLRGLIPAATDAQAASGVPVTVVTELARTMLPASGFSAASAVSAITDAASSVIGVASYSQAMLPPVFNAQGQTSDQVTLKLAALAHVINQQGSGANLPAKLKNIAAQLAAGSAVSAVIPQTIFNNALGAVNGGASSLLPVGATPPTIPVFTLPGGSLGNTISAGGGGSVTAVPAVPVGLTATVASSSQIDLNWAAAANATGYNIYRANAAYVATSVANKLNAAPLSATAYNDTGLQPNATYFYKVAAVNTPAGLQSMGSTEVSATTNTAGGGGGAGPAPTGLAATTRSFSQIALTWNAVGSSTYKIYRSATSPFTTNAGNLVGSYSGASILLGAFGPGPFVDTNLTPNTMYYYKIAEVPIGGIESLSSTEVSATTNALSGIVGVDWINNPIGSGAGITSVAWSGAKYVAVDMVGTAHVSTDAITWTSYNTGVALPLTSITWSGTQFVAVGQTGSVVTSPDGITWTVRTSGSNSYLYEVTWSGTQFVAVGGNSTVLTSPDAITWTLQNSGLQVIVSLASVTWSGSQFVAVSSGGKIITSSDGVSWFVATSYTSNNLQSVVWNGSKFFAVGAGGQVLSSPDGTTWSQAAIGNSTTLNSLIWTGQQFIAAGNSGVILRSPDGVTWTPVASGTTLQLNSITGSGNTYVIVGNGVVLKSL